MLRLCYPVSNTVRSGGRFLKVSVPFWVWKAALCLLCLHLRTSFNNFENNTTKVSVKKEQLTVL